MHVNTLLLTLFDELLASHPLSDLSIIKNGSLFDLDHINNRELKNFKMANQYNVPNICQKV